MLIKQLAGILEAKESVIEKKYPNTEAGVKQYMEVGYSKAFLKKLDLPTCKFSRDPEVDGVWAVDSMASGYRCIIYLAGYKEPMGDIRRFNDQEEGGFPMRMMKQMVEWDELTPKQVNAWKAAGSLIAADATKLLDMMKQRGVKESTVNGYLSKDPYAYKDAYKKAYIANGGGGRVPNKAASDKAYAKVEKEYGPEAVKILKKYHGIQTDAASKAGNVYKESLMSEIVRLIPRGYLSEGNEPKFRGYDVSHEEDGIMVLVMGPSEGHNDDYHGITVFFKKSGTKPELVTGDSYSSRQAKQYKAEIIAAAENRLTAADKKHLASL